MALFNPQHAHSSPTAHGGKTAVVGSWVATSYGSARPMRFIKQMPRLSAFAVRADGTYDSEGYLGYGRWTLRGWRLVLSPDASRLGPPIALLYQDFSGAMAHRNRPLVLEVGNGHLRLLSDDRYGVGKHWTSFERTRRQLRYSAEKLANGSGH